MDEDQNNNAPVYSAPTMTNRLMDGDNVLRMKGIDDASVDLIYMDPPYKSGRKYNQIIDRAHEEAYSDMYTWNDAARSKFGELTKDYDATDPVQKKVAIWLQNARLILADNAGGTLAYLVEMAPVLVECRRLLKQTGSIYIHLDPTVVHYVKELGDLVFGPQNFQGEVVWKRNSAHNDARGYGSIHDSILFFTKSSKFTWNGEAARHAHDPEYVESFYRHEDDDGRRYSHDNLSAAGLSGGGYDYEWGGVTRTWRCPIETMQRLHDEGRIYYPVKPTGERGVPRLKRYLDEAKGVPLQDMWLDVAPVGSKSPENRNFEGQKPLKLVERIVLTSSNPGDRVLDPYLGSGTTGIAAGLNGRAFTGIELTAKSMAKARDAMAEVLGEGWFVEDFGAPADMEHLRTLIARDRSGKILQHWAVRMLHGTPFEKMSDDKGKDGTFSLGGFGDGRAREGIIQVTGMKEATTHFNSFLGWRQRHERDNQRSGDDRIQPVGVYVCLPEAVTDSMRIAAEDEGEYESGFKDDPRRYPKLQIITFDKFFDRNKPVVDQLRVPGYIPRPLYTNTVESDARKARELTRFVMDEMPQKEEGDDRPCEASFENTPCRREYGHAGNHYARNGLSWDSSGQMLTPATPPPEPKPKKRSRGKGGEAPKDSEPESNDG